MELSKLKTREKHEEGIEVQIKSPTGDPSDFYIKIVGPDSKAWRKLQKSEIKEFLTPDRKEPTEDEALDRDVARLVSITIGWRGLTDNGEEVKFSPLACADLYTEAPYIMDQIDIAAGKFRNFIKD